MEVKDILQTTQRILTVEESKALLNTRGIRTNQSFLAKDARHAARLARKVGFPVAMKIVSPDIVHKTEAGGVRIDIKTEEEVKKTFKSIVESARAYSTNPNIKGILVEEMADGIEMIVGAVRDPTFGHLIMFGLGGIFVEVFRDVSFRVVPIDKRDALEMIDEIKGKAIIEGARGQKSVSKDRIKDVLVGVSDLIEKHPQITELDINPLMGDGERVIAVDARIIIGG